MRGRKKNISSGILRERERLIAITTYEAPTRSPDTTQTHVMFKI